MDPLIFKKMIKYSYIILAILLSTQLSYSQSETESKNMQKNKSYTGAKADQENYKAIYQLDTNDPKIIQKTIRNINNALEDPRLKGKLEIELITFSGGTEALLKKNSQYEKPLKDLINKGVTVAQCENSLKEQGRTKSELYEFVGYVPSGNGELIIRANQGWIIVKP